MVRRKPLLIGMATIVLIVAFYFYYPNSNLSDNNQAENNNAKNEPKIDEHAIFLVEHPKYKQVNEHIIDYLSPKEMIDETNRKQTSLHLMEYFQESFGEADILDEYDLYFDIRNDILVVTLLHRRYWDEDRVILYNLVDHTIDKEVTMDLYYELNFLNFLFELSSMEKILERKSFNDLHKQIVQIEQDQSLPEEHLIALADSMIYYLYGMMTEDIELIKYFSNPDEKIEEKNLFIFDDNDKCYFELENLTSYSGYYSHDIALKFICDHETDSVQFSVCMLEFISISIVPNH